MVKEKKKQSSRLTKVMDHGLERRKGRGKKKSSVKVVHAQIVDRTAQKKSTKKAKSEKIVTTQNEEQKEEEGC